MKEAFEPVSIEEIKKNYPDSPLLPVLNATEPSRKKRLKKHCPCKKCEAWRWERHRRLCQRVIKQSIEQRKSMSQEEILVEVRKMMGLTPRPPSADKAPEFGVHIGRMTSEPQSQTLERAPNFFVQVSKR